MALTTVYQYFASNGALIYVGITDRGTRRLHEHAESKPWWKLATGCTLEHFGDRDLALAREKQLIERYRPPYNYQHNPERSLPLEERVNRRIHVGPKVHGKSHIAGADVRQRRKAWGQLSKQEQLATPCVVCQERPGHAGKPTCLNCRQSEQMNGQKMTPAEHRLAHRTLAPHERCPFGAGCQWQKKRDAEAKASTESAAQ